MRVAQIAMLAADTPRTAAYLQALLKKQLLPSYVVVLSEEKTVASSPEQAAKKNNLPDGFSLDTYFDPSVSLIEFLVKNKIDYSIAGSKNVNDPLVIDAVKARKEKYFIYSGLGGQILKEDILSCGKKIFHFHPGRVPDYRGSTTVYYSILNEDRCHVSAFFLERKIDTGPLIKIREFSPPPDGRIIDIIYDSYIRAELLVEVMEEFVKTGAVTTCLQPEEKGETYFIIHPVLKHIAILACAD